LALKAANVDRSYLTSGRTIAFGHARTFNVAVALPNFCPVFAGKPNDPLVRALMSQYKTARIVPGSVKSV